METSPVTRGVVFAPQTRRVSAAVEDEFGFAETTLVSFEDLYAGELHAAPSIDALSQATDIAPTHVHAWVALAVSNQTVCKQDDALATAQAHFEKVVEYAPGSSIASLAQRMAGKL